MPVASSIEAGTADGNLVFRQCCTSNRYNRETERLHGYEECSPQQMSDEMMNETKQGLPLPGDPAVH